MNSLKECISKYSVSRSEDNFYGTDKDTAHSYGDLYESLFKPYRNSCTDFLEIGIFSGGSLTAFCEYFPNAQILGVDITLSNVIFGKDNPRIKMIEADGTTLKTAEMISSIGRQFDIILDDGSHDPRHQVSTLNFFAPLLRKGGIFVIEDISQDHIGWLKDSLENVGKSHGLSMEWYDLRGIKGRFDDIVAVFRHV